MRINKFKEFFKSDKQKTKEKFLNLFEIDASDIDEIMWDIRDEMEVVNIRYELITPSLTTDLFPGKNSKFKMVINPLNDTIFSSLDVVFSDAYENRQTQKYLFNFCISFVLNCYKKDLDENILKIEETYERINDILQFDNESPSITSRGTIDELVIGHHKVSMNFYLFK